MLFFDKENIYNLDNWQNRAPKNSGAKFFLKLTILPSETLPSYHVKPYQHNTLGILFPNEFLIPYNEFLIHRKSIHGKFVRRKKLTI